MNRKLFITSLLMAIAAPFLPSVEPKKRIFISDTPRVPMKGSLRSNPEVIAPLDKLKQRFNYKSNWESETKKIEIKGSMPIEYFKANKDPANKLGYNEYKIKRNRLN